MAGIFVAPWLSPPDFLGASEAGARLGLSRAEMLQQAEQHAAELALQRDQLGAQRQAQAQRQGALDQQREASLALREAQLQQQGLLGGERIQNQQDALSAREALDAANETAKANKQNVINTPGGAFQMVNGQYVKIPGSEKAEEANNPPSQGTVIVPVDGVDMTKGSIEVPINSPLYQKWNAMKSTVTPSPAIPPTPDKRFLGIPIPWTGSPGQPAGATSVTNNPPSLSQFMQSSDNLQPAAAALTAPPATNSGLPDLTGVPAPATPSGIPAVGAVVNGFTFQGGDPAQQTNWVQQAQQP